MRSPATLGVLLLTVVGAALRFATVGRQSYWYDEAITATMLDGSLVDVFTGVAETESTPPLYYVLGWMWAQLGGTEEGSLRSLSALFGTLTIPVAYAAGRLLVSTRAGVAATALAAVSPLLVWYSQEARAYALLTLLAGASFVLFLLARSEPSSRRLAAWAVVSALALLTHYFAVFVIAVEAGALLWTHPRLRRLRWAVGAIAAVGVCLLPLAAAQARHRRLGWIGGLDLADRVTEALQRLVTAAPPSSWAGSTGTEVSPHVWLVAGGTLVLAAVLLATLGSAREQSGAALALVIGSLAICVPVAISLFADLVLRGEGDLFLDRNVIGAWVPLAVFVAGGLTTRRAGLVGVLCVAGLVAWSLIVTVQVATRPDLQRDDWRGAARAVAIEERSVVVVYPAYQSAALVRQLPAREELGERVTVEQIVLVLAGFDEPPSSFVVPSGFEEARSETVQHFRVLEYRAPSPLAVQAEDLAQAPLRESDLAVLAPAAG